MGAMTAEDATADRPTRVVIADDNEVLVEALVAAIDAFGPMEVVATAGDGRAVTAAVRAERPDVVLMDLRLGGEWGLDLLPEIRSGSAPPAVVVFSAAELDGLADDAARAGAFRLVPKGAPLREVLAAITEAAASRQS